MKTSRFRALTRTFTRGLGERSDLGAKEFGVRIDFIGTLAMRDRLRFQAKQPGHFVQREICSEFSILYEMISLSGVGDRRAVKICDESESGQNIVVVNGPARLPAAVVAQRRAGCPASPLFDEQPVGF